MEDSITEFFNDKSIFITGATGFMGKILLEKLVRSCPNLSKIYVLVRLRKKDESVEKKINKILQLPLFDRVKQEQPGVIEKKIIPVRGDAQKLDLGLSAENKKIILDNVSIVFHVAASVRFDDPINDAVIMNTRSTREVVNLVKQLKNIEVFVHVSTTYCNCYRKVVEEKIYPASMDWREAIYIAENADTATMNVISHKFLGMFPNSYVFSKNLAEQLIHDECQNIPTVIFRPSIVISTCEEPMPGWIDNLHGPVGLFIGIGKGVVRVAISDNSTRPDYMPVDLAIKGIIVAAWKKAVKFRHDENKISVYNGSSSYKSITTKELVRIAMKYIFVYPYPNSIWIPTILITPNKFYFYINVLLQQLLPSVIIDAICKFMNKKTINLMTLQRKIYQASLALAYFTAKHWTFINTNFLQLLNDIPKSDKQEFNFSFHEINPEEYLGNALVGGHKFLLNTDFNQIPKEISRQKMYKFIQVTAKITFLVLIVWYLFNLLSSNTKELSL